MYIITICTEDYDSLSTIAYSAILLPEAINHGRAISNDMQNRAPT